MNPSQSNPPEDADDSVLMELIEDPTETAEAGAGAAWKVLVVDDDEDVHHATDLAMRGLPVEGRQLEFLHAHSAESAHALIVAHPDIAVVLLDVVMETPDAGLRLVRQVREELGRDALRVILRTGQPGYAPELDTVRAYDINDYRTKSELTRVRLFTSLTSAVRSYRQIVALQETRRGLEMLVHASTEISKLRGLQHFADGVIVQLCALLDIDADGLVCAQASGPGDDPARIIAAAGRHAGLMNRPLAELPSAPIRAALENCLATRKNTHEPHLALYFSSSSGRGMAAFVDAPLSKPVDHHLLAVFCASISTGLENVLLYGQLVDLAYRDQLLNIPNRNRFIEVLDGKLDQPAGVTMAVIDIDDFAGINATLGHRFGDQVLKALCERLISNLGLGAVIARVAGDVFGVVGPDAAIQPEALSLALAAPLDVQGQQVRLSATAGLVRIAEGSPSAVELLKDAHIALKQAKERNRGAALYFNPSMGTDSRERMRLLHGLREAFEADRLFIAYQPQVTLADGKVIGAEALLRWRTEDGKFVPPDRFIPVAEQSGLIVAIGEFVLRTACHQLKRLNEQGVADFRMSVNVSQAQFREPSFVNHLRHALRDSGVEPAQVELEITESMAAEDFDFVISTLAAVKSTGVSVAIDDFGTGFSSLSVLRQLQTDRLKIDRAFVGEIGNIGDRGSIARMVIDLGRSLGMKVIAEGVETEAQRTSLVAMGCDEGQGYLFARPMPAEQMEAWLRDKG